MSSSYEQSKAATGISGTVPIGELIMGGSYSKDEFEQKQKQMASANFRSLTSQQRLEAVGYVSDSGIVKAWSDCMNKQGGIAMSFSTITPTVANLSITYRALGTSGSTKLSYPVSLQPMVDIKMIDDPFNCLGTGREIAQNLPCEVTITTKDARTIIIAKALAADSSASAMLPPRIKLLTEFKTWKPAPEEHNVNALHQVKDFSWTHTLSDEELNAGWQFEPATAKVDVYPVHYNKGDCRKLWQTPSAYAFSFGIQGYGPDRGGHGKDGHAICNIAPSIRMVRTSWVPLEN